MSENRDGMESSNESKKFSWSEWKRPVIAIVLTFLCNVESIMLAMGEWPYMAEIDHKASASFFGYATAASKAGHASFAFIPMLTGRCITLAACVMYIFVEFIPSNRRWWMLVCYVLFGVGFGTSPLLRSYIARVTSEENRSTAYALQNGALVLSVVVGPRVLTVPYESVMQSSKIAQLSFAGLPYPGAIIIPPNIKLNIYTEKGQSSFSFASIRERLANLRTLNLPWLLVILVIFEKMVSGLFGSTMAAFGGPMLSSMFALSGHDIILLNAIGQIATGLIASGAALVFFECKLGKRVSCRVLLVISHGLIIAGPSSPSAPIRLNLSMVVNIIPFVIVLIITLSFSIPTAMLSLDTIYSKIIGNIDQNVMQSIFVIAEDIMQIVGPIYGTAIFTAIGISYINIINVSIYIIAVIVWLAAWKWPQPYD